MQCLGSPGLLPSHRDHSSPEALRLMKCVQSSSCLTHLRANIAPTIGYPNISKDGDSTPSLGKLVQYLTILTVKK